MKLLEVVELRTAAGTAAKVEEYLRDWVRQYDRGAVVARSYRHASLETDFSIHMSYESNNDETVPFTAGKQLAASLKDFGLVHRSVWVEQEFDG